MNINVGFVSDFPNIWVRSLPHFGQTAMETTLETRIVASVRSAH
jgi:hypothetical protein